MKDAVEFLLTSLRHSSEVIRILETSDISDSAADLIREDIMNSQRDLRNALLKLELIVKIQGK